MIRRMLRRAADRLRMDACSRLGRAQVSIFHPFVPPPYGGGNQFLLALRREWTRRGLIVGQSYIGPATRAALLNSFTVPAEDLRRMRRPACRLVHRVDGPIGLYRGDDDRVDRQVEAINREFAEATIFQSRFSLEAHRALGIELCSPVVIPNAADPAYFHPRVGAGPVPGAKLRLISTSWSSNPNKGADAYRWLDQHLDFERYAYTFVGRSPVSFRNIRLLAPLPSDRLGKELREHDVYITASQNDPCSNALIEALACGLPALYADSGGHPELVGDAGFPFAGADEVPALLDRLEREHAERRARIRVPELSDVATRYLEVLGLAGEVAS